MADTHDIEFLGSQFALEVEGVEMARFTEIGVAIVRPAEFVIFRISQFTAPSK